MDWSWVKGLFGKKESPVAAAPSSVMNQAPEGLMMEPDYGQPGAIVTPRVGLTAQPKRPDLARDFTSPTDHKIQQLLLEGKTAAQESAKSYEEQMGLPLILRDIQESQAREARIQEQIQSTVAQLRTPAPEQKGYLSASVPEGLAALIAVIAGRDPGRVNAGLATQVDARQMKEWENRMREMARADEATRLQLGLNQNELQAARGDRAAREEFAQKVRAGALGRQEEVLQQYRDRGWKLQDVETAQRQAELERRAAMEDWKLKTDYQAALGQQVERDGLIWEQEVLAPLKAKNAGKGAVAEAAFKSLFENRDMTAVEAVADELQGMGVPIGPGMIDMFKALAEQNRQDQDFKNEMAKQAYGLDVYRATQGAGVGAAAPITPGPYSPNVRPSGGAPGRLPGTLPGVPMPGAAAPAGLGGSPVKVDAAAVKDAEAANRMTVAGLTSPDLRGPALKPAEGTVLRQLRERTGKYYLLKDEISAIEKRLGSFLVFKDSEGNLWHKDQTTGVSYSPMKASAFKRELQKQVDEGRSRMGQLKAEHTALMSEARSKLGAEYWNWVEAMRKWSLSAIKTLAATGEKEAKSPNRGPDLPDRRAEQEKVRRLFSTTTGADFEVAGK